MGTLQKKNLGKPLLSVWILVQVVCYAIPSNAGIIDLLGPEATLLCAGITGIPALVECESEFERNLQEYSNAFNQEQKDKENLRIPEYAICCQVNILQSCIAKQVSAICGSNAEEVAKVVMSTFLKTLKYISNQVNENGNINCDWDAFYFRKESPICWPYLLQIGSIVLLATIFLVCCCCRICRRCCCKKAQVVQTVFIPCTTNNFPSRSDNLPPYQQLGKTEL